MAQRRKKKASKKKKAAARTRAAGTPAGEAAAARIHAIPLLEEADSVHEPQDERRDIHACLVTAFEAVGVTIVGEQDRISWGTFTERDCHDINGVLFGCLTDKGYSPVPVTPVLLRLREKDAVLSVEKLLDWLVKVTD